MSSRFGKLLLVLLVPALLYGAVKGYFYYTAKHNVDQVVEAAADQADITYADISTDLRGAVTVSGISILPLGKSESVEVDALRVASDDPMFFLRGGRWQPGENAPPDSLSFQVSGVRVPVSSTLFAELAAAGDASGGCENGLTIDPQLLASIGFSELRTDIDGFYRLDRDLRTLEVGVNLDLQDIESTRFSATLSDVDVESLERGVPPTISLGRFSVAVRIAPEFGRRATKACATGTELTVQQWSEQFAAQALAGFEQQGLSLGYGLSEAVRRFYRDWGEFRFEAVPAQPVGLLSLMFLPPDQLADTLGLRMTLNDELITDTGFTWEQPQEGGLAALLGRQANTTTAAAPGNRPKRRLVRREYESVRVGEIARYVGYQVRIKPRGLPQREGLLRQIRDGQAEVQQTVHGGKFTVYVSLGEIESVQALIQHEVASQ